MKQIYWFDITSWGEMIVRKFRGNPIEETEETITIKYNRKNITLNKKECQIYDI